MAVHFNRKRRLKRLRTVTVGAGGSFAKHILNLRFPSAELKKLFEGSFSVAALLIPEKKTISGLLVASTSVVWEQVIKSLKEDWSLAYSIAPEKWEELIAGAFKGAGFDDVTLTPRSGDFGRDLIAVRKGLGCVKIVGSVKAYKPGHLVKHDDIRAFLHVINAERDTSKGIFATTSGFAPRIASDPFIAPYLPTRLELVDGPRLHEWLTDLNNNPDR